MKKSRLAQARPKPRNPMVRALHDPLFRARSVPAKSMKMAIRRKGCLRRQLAAAADLFAGSRQPILDTALAQLARAPVS